MDFLEPCDQPQREVDAMGLSARAQIKSLGGQYAARTVYEVADKSEAHQFSETTVYYSYKKTPTRFLLPEHLKIKQTYLPLLESITGEDEFRAKCGDAFVIGIQRRSAHYATWFLSSKKNVTSSSRKFPRTLRLNSTSVRDRSRAPSLN